MKQRTLRSFIELVPLLLSEDVESVALGLSLFTSWPPFVNLNKHYKMCGLTHWPRSNKRSIPDHLVQFYPSYGRYYSWDTQYVFSKKLFTNLGDKTPEELYFLAVTAISWVEKYTSPFSASDKKCKHDFFDHSTWNDDWMNGKLGPRKKVDRIKQGQFF